MKRFLGLLFAFALIVIIVAPFLLLIQNPQRKMTYGRLNTRLREVENFRDVDILFCGASRTYRGFDPRIFQEHGFYTFNLGSSSQTPIQTKVLLDKYVVGLNPRLVILEVNPDAFSSDGVESTLDVLANDRVNATMIESFLNIRNVQVYHYLAYALLRDALGLAINYTPSTISDGDTYISGGYVQKELMYFSGPYDVPRTTWVPNQSQIAAFSEIITRLKSAGIAYLLVSVPCTHIQNERYTNMRDFHNMVQQYGDYYDFNELLDLDDALYFYDAQHLNQNGVEVFNKAFIKTLLNEGSN